MSNSSIQEIVEYDRLGRIRIKSGLIFGKLRDPSEDVESEVRHFLAERREYFNKKVSDTFDLPEGGFTKFEFYWTPQRMRKVTSPGDMIGSKKVSFRSSADVTLLYLKERSVIIFKTEYLFAITEPGCGGTGILFQSGGRNFTLEEIYFNKITTVGAYHEEERYNVVNPGCSGKEVAFTISRDGFIVRAGESFKVLASERFNQELRDARSMINEKISGTN